MHMMVDDSRSRDSSLSMSAPDISGTILSPVNANKSKHPIHLEDIEAEDAESPTKVGPSSSMVPSLQIEHVQLQGRPRQQSIQEQDFGKREELLKTLHNIKMQGLEAKTDRNVSKEQLSNQESSPTSQANHQL